MAVRKPLLGTALAFAILETIDIPDTGAPAIVFSALFYGSALLLWRRDSRVASALIAVLCAVEATQAETWQHASQGIKVIAMLLGSAGIALAGAHVLRTKAAVPVATLALAAILAASASAASTGQTLQFVGVQTSFAQDSQAPTVGSRLFFGQAIYNKVPQFGKPAGARIGHTEGVCTIVTPHNAQCLITAHVPNGQIVVAGSILLSEGLATNHFAIVGGAGAYGSVRGTVLARDLSPTKSLVTLKLGA